MFGLSRFRGIYFYGGDADFRRSVDGFEIREYFMHLIEKLPGVKTLEAFEALLSVSQQAIVPVRG